MNDRVESIIGNFQHASIQRSDQTPGGIDDIYRDLFELNPYDMDEIQFQVVNSDVQEGTRPDADEIKIMDAPNAEVNDEWINTLVTIPYDGEMVTGAIKRRKKDGDSGLLQGKAHENPLLDIRLYEVEMPDGTYADYHANNLIENIYNSVDDFGYSELLINEIIDHQRNTDAIDRRDGWVRTQYGSTKRVITTKGWDLKILWNDGTSSWIQLKDIKESNPVEVAEYAIRSNISNEPAFA